MTVYWKSQLKLFLKSKLPIVHNFLATMHHVYALVRVYISLTQVARTLPPVGDRSDKLILINMVRGYLYIQMILEGIFALKLIHMGHKVVILFDDGILLHHDTMTKADLHSWKPYYPFRRRLGEYLLSRIPVIRELLVPYSDIYQPTEADRIRVLNNKTSHRTESYVMSSLTRFYLSTPSKDFLEAEPDFEMAREMFLLNAAYADEIARRAYERYKPDLMMSTHGIYTSWGIFMDYFRLKKVECITYTFNGFSNNTLRFRRNEIYPEQNFNAFFLDYFVQIKKNPTEMDSVCKQADAIMNQRINFGSKDLSRYGVKKDTNAKVVDWIKTQKEEGRLIFGMFPGLMWDLDGLTYFGRNRVFSGPVEWIQEVTKYFLEAKDMALIIRPHPYESNRSEIRVDVKKILQQYFGSAIDEATNILLIEESDRFGSYGLFSEFTGILTFNGTIELEALYSDIPVIAGAKGHWTDLGFIYNNYNPEQFFTALRDTNTILQRQITKKEMIKAYIYFHFFLDGVPFPFLSLRQIAKPEYSVTPEEILGDPILHAIMQMAVDQNSNFYDWIIYQNKVPNTD